MMRSMLLIGSLIALLMYVGFAAQQTGAQVTGAPLLTAAAPVHVPDVKKGPAAKSVARSTDEETPRRFAPLAFLTEPKNVCPVQVEGTPTNAGR
jgi:hypothetical protein